MTFTVVWGAEPVAALRRLRREDPAAAKTYESVTVFVLKVGSVRR
jgi:hypothetical protein